MNGKGGITIAPNHSETSVIKMKHYCSYVRKIKNETGQTPTLTWSIVRTVPAYSNTTKKSAFCLHEK